MAIIYKFRNKKSKKPYSDTFISEVDAVKVAEFLKAENPVLPTVILLSMANAIIASTHLQLLLEEHNIVVPETVYDSFENDEVTYLDCKSKTVH
ncbi:MAG: hypothetical protein O3A39_06845 [Proteobacteria bacterium]|nr:hypothetical protein [Pseudomonadota bacterium]